MVRNAAVRARAICQRNIAAGVVLIFLDHEIEGKMRAFKVYALARANVESSRVSFFLIQHLHRILQQNYFSPCERTRNG